MVIDIHTHIFPPEVIAQRERFFENEPEFRLLYGPQKSKMASAESLLDSMDANGVDRSVTFGFPWHSPDLRARHNDYVLESAAKYPSRLIALACLDLLSDSCIEDAAAWQKDGAAGFGELAVYAAGSRNDLAIRNFRLLGDLCRQSGLVLLAHANEPIGHNYPGKAPFGLDFYYSMAEAAQGVPLILAHWGGGLLFYELLKKDAPEKLANVFYDTAASPYLYKSEIYTAAVSIVGKDKILFGSDYPLIGPKRYFEEIRASGLSEPQVRAVLGRNAARIFGLTG